MTGGVQANSLAAISELMNGNWWGGAQGTGGANAVIVDPKSSASLKKSGLPFSIDKSGPSFNFLIGRTGVGGISFGRPEELFEMVGRSLVSWVLDPVVSDSLVAYVVANWKSQAAKNDQKDVLVYEPGSPTPPHEIGYPNISGLGFARVGVGSEYFRNYSAKRIARDSIEIAARSHLSNPEAVRIAKKLNTINPEEVSSEWARQLVNEFLRNCNLSEVGPKENQIQDALTPAGFLNLQGEFQALAREKAESFVPKNPKGEDWIEAIESGIEVALEQFLKDSTAGFNEQIGRWVTGEGPERVLRVVEEQITRCGLLTTARIVGLASQQLKSEVVPELQNRDLADYQRWASSWKSEVRAALNSQASRRLGAEDPLVDKALQEGVLYAKYQANVQMVDVIAELIEDFCDGFMKPLADSLQDASSKADRAFEESQSWPEWNLLSPPSECLPPSSEFTIINPDEYGALFEDLLAKSYSDKDQNMARELTRNQVISAEFVRTEVERNTRKKRDLEHLFAIHVAKEWWPRASLLTDGVKSKSNAYFEVRMTADQILDRADSWLLKPNSPFAEVLDADLSTFLGRSDAFGNSPISDKDQKKRRDRFLTQFKEALNAAEPLVNVNKGLLSLVHDPAKMKNHSVISQIPLANSEVRGEIEVILRQRGKDDAEIQNLLVAPNGDEKKKYVDVSSVLWPPMSMIPIESLFKPIAADWSKSVAAGGQGAFWMHRRSTTLQEFIPAPQALIVGLVRGWYVARMMGLVVRRSPGNGRISISIGKEGRAEFPYPFLSSSADKDDEICLILESLSIAFANCSVVGNLSPLRPYRELRDLGKSLDNTFFEYENVGERFADFLTIGESPYKLVEPLAKGTTMLERTESVTTQLLKHRGDLSEKYEEVMGKRRITVAKLSTPPMFTGLWFPISKALTDLTRAVENFGRSGSTVDEL
jgi:hypothetical protein